MITRHDARHSRAVVLALRLQTRHTHEARSQSNPQWRVLVHESVHELQAARDCYALYGTSRASDAQGCRPCRRRRPNYGSDARALLDAR